MMGMTVSSFSRISRSLLRLLRSLSIFSIAFLSAAMIWVFSMGLVIYSKTPSLMASFA